MEISKLLEIFEEGKSPRDLGQSFRSDSIRPGLERFYSILKSGIGDLGNGRRGFEIWTRPQIEAVVSVAKLIISATISGSVEHVDSLVLLIVESSLEFCICYLEKSLEDCADLSLQNGLVLLMEIALTDEIGKELNVTLHEPSSTYLVPLSVIPVDVCSLDLSHTTVCNPQGNHCLKKTNSVGMLVKALASEVMQPDNLVKRFTGSLPLYSSYSMVSLAQHWTVVHLKFFPRLLLLCCKLLHNPVIFEEHTEADSNYSMRLSLSLRVLKLLGNLARGIPHDSPNIELLCALASCAETFPTCFKLKMDSANSDWMATGSNTASILLMVMEEFLQFVQIVSLDCSFLQNIPTCLVAAMLGILDSKEWRDDTSNSSPRPPLIYHPQVVLYLLKLLKDSNIWKEIRDDPSDYCCESEAGVSCCIRSEKFFFLKKYTCEQKLRIIFPASEQWVDNLTHLAFFLYFEGLKSRPKVETLVSTCTKPAVVPELESAVSHEEDALFGNLFSEAGRSVGSADGLDQPISAVTVISSSHHFQAVIELLSFLKAYVFSYDLNSPILLDAFGKIDKNLIDYLLSILISQVCLTDERNLGSSAALPLQKTLMHVNENCFGLLHNLITQQAFPISLIEHLIDQVLKVENGIYIYNNYSLALLAHVLISRPCVDGARVRRKICNKFSDFMLEKAKNVLLKCPEPSNFFRALPSSFHLEILLLAFHLSDQPEKMELANSMFYSLRKIDAPPDGSSGRQHFYWGLIVSRLVLILRHMVLYPSSCPSWLLSHLRSRLREISSSGCFPQALSERLPSCASTVVETILGDYIKEVSLAGELLPQLIDVTPLPSALCRKDHSFQHLGLNLDDLFASLSWILDTWSGKMAKAVEHLVLERYIFLLCWDTLSCINSCVSRSLLMDCNWLNIDLLNVESFFRFGLIVTSGSSDILKDIDLSEIIFNLLQQLHCDLVPDKVVVQGWDFFKRGSWLTLVLSVLRAGIWRYSARHAVPGIESYWVEHPKGCDFFDIAEKIILNLFQGNKSGWLLNVLSSILSTYLEVFQRAFLSILDCKKFYEDGFSPLLLLKHTRVDKTKQDILLERSGCKFTQLESVYGLMSKLDEVSTKAEAENKGVLNCLLHGFPSLWDPSSAALLSSVLTIREIMCTLDGYLKIKDAAGVHVETKIVSQLLSKVMAIKSDRGLQGVHEKCETIYSSSIDQEKVSGYYDLFSLKQIEDFLANINSREVIDTETHEMLITSVVDSIQALRRDNSKVEIFKFYMGIEEDVSEEAKDLFSEHRGDLLVLFDALVKCHSETVNLKILYLFTDLLDSGLCPGLKEKIQKKFLDMELLCISKFLEKRLLGSTNESPGGIITAKGSSTSLRESTMEFMMRIVIESNESLAEELHHRLIEAMLMSVDAAFLLYDVHTAKSYFSYLVRLLNGETSIRQLLEKTVMLIEKLAENDGLLEGLKFLLGFLGTALGDCGADRNTSEKHPSKGFSSDSFGSGSVISKTVESRKDSLNLVLLANQSGSASIERDATSADEDEDDGTSDGELGSIDKDEEEDSNSERALASKVCTFTSSGSNFMEQHWYFCYTCDLTISKGCCSICAKVCHRGHRVVYSRSSRFFCDCGAGGVRGSSCQCLKPRKFSGSNNVPAQRSNNFQPFFSFPEDVDQAADSDSDLDYNVCMDIDNVKLSIPREVQDGLSALLGKLNMEDRVLEICSRLLHTVVSRKESNLSKDKKVILGNDKMLSYNVDILQLKKAFKSGSLDLKIKTDYPNSRELKSHLSSGSLNKSLLSVSVRGRLAAGEGDKVTIFDVGQLIGHPTVTPVTADKTNVKPLSRNIVRFEIVHLMFNPMVETYLAVAGYEECQVLTVNSCGEVTDRLSIELALQGSYIRRIEWIPGSQVQLMVVTNMFVKIYDLSQDNISPMHYFTLSNDLIIDATLVPASMGKLFLLVFSEDARLYRLEVSMEGDTGVQALTDIIQVQDKDVQPKGLSLSYSSTYRLVLLSYQDGTSLVGRLDSSATSLNEISTIYEDDQGGKDRPACLHHWKELLSGSGVFVCFSNLKSNAAIAVSMGPQELVAQNIKHGAGSALPVVGIAAYKPLSKDKMHCLVLHEDGSLQIYTHVPLGADTGVSLSADQTKKLGTSILQNKAYAGPNPEFPLDFFEKTMCITADIKLSSDAMKSIDSEGIKQKLASDDGFLESPSSVGFKVTVLNSNPDIVMVGFRIHVGNTSAVHIPSEIILFQRVIKLDEGMRSWYDVPLTIAESLLADEEFTICVGRTFDGSTMPRIDSLEVYGRAKDEFGWKEKMDAVLHMEAHTLCTNSSAAGAGKKYKTMQAALIEEQVLADALKLLSRVYSCCGPHFSTQIQDVKLELDRLKCKEFLETLFESDKEPLLHSAACHVLQAVFPKKEIYYHVKDTMCLLGVVKSIPMLVSRIGIGGAAATWVITEFTSQMQAVSKIALNRRLNMVSFLEAHGSAVVDGLMQVLWGILDLERPGTQTVNNIVIPSVELIYSYAECLALHGTETSGRSVASAIPLLKKLLFAPYEAVQTSSSLAISSRLLQVPFPKQTMLSTDDAAENTVTTHVPSGNATGGNTQVMVEEDSSTSTVQYCCDGCSTVPILRRRWHCNVCPDFDLCEACYEVPDTDRLPPPHSRDHPMSAIPIEIDPLGGDGSEIHFSMDELNDAGVIQVTADVSMQNSPSSVHNLEASETGDFPSSVDDQRIVSISASKRAVNSLLLRHLVEELKGWMETTSGVRAIPVMQLFYRLSSAVGGPFMDSSKPENLDLEKFVKWLLDEINLSKPFSAKSRTLFGEVAILVFMYFTLMLRNWHQPNSDSSQSKSGATADSQDRGFVQIPSMAPASPSNDDHEQNEFASQLMRACSTLRQQSFLNYLMDILQQLVYIFKSSSVDVENGLSAAYGCGSLLTVRRELPAGNFSPFFTDSYAKAHRSDIFMDYHKLLLENTFRLVYSLVRPEKQEKSAEKSYKICAGLDLKLEGFQDVLCSYISNPHTTFVRRYARRLFLHLCGSKTHYYSVRDSCQLSTEVKRFYKIIDKSGGFQNPMPYERSVKLVKCLSAISEVAGARPKNWQKYCTKHLEILPFLMDGIFYFGEEPVLRTLKLLNLAFYTGKEMGHSSKKMEAGEVSNKGGQQYLDSKKKRKGEDGTEGGSEKSCVDMEQAIGIFGEKGGSILQRFINSFLLEWNSSSVRLEAKCVLYGIWHHGKQSFKEAMLTALLQKVKLLPMYGQNIVEYTELMTCLLSKGLDSSAKQYEIEVVDRCLKPDVISCIFETLHAQNELLANHPNSRMYNTLSSLVEFDGYYLESEPCVACSCPEVPYNKMKLESLKSETKFTDNRIIVKCTGSYTIQSVTMNVHDARKSKSVKILNLYYNNRPVADLSELKNNWSLWKRAKSCHLAFNQTELKVEFPIPITACNFMIELDSFYENLQASSLESLQCPRCSRSVTDKHGICSNCHENAYQCRQCRNINYENLDSFLCNECGYSKYGRFEFNFMAKPSFSFDNMENDDDMKKGLSAIESESENAHRRYQQLLGFKKPLLKLVSSIGEHEIDSQQKDTVQQMMASLPGPSCKINRKIALLGVLYGEKCKAAFDSVSKSVQTLQGLRRVLLTYLHQKNSVDGVASSKFTVPRSANNCYGCATTFVSKCMELLQVLSEHANCKKQLVAAGILSELFENNIHQGPKMARVQARTVLCAFSEGDASAVTELNVLIQNKVMYCLKHHRSMDIALAVREEMLLLSETCSVVDEFWEARLRVAFQVLFASIKSGAKHPAISEHIILPCLRIISQACTPPKSDAVDKDQGVGKSASTPQSKNDGTLNPSLNLSTFPSGSKLSSEIPEKLWDGGRKGQDIPLMSYSEWERGASYLDFVRRQSKVSQVVKSSTQRARHDSQKHDYLAIKYALKWKRRACTRRTKSDFLSLTRGSWVSELILSACSQSIRSEVCTLISVLCPPNSFRRFQLLNLLMSLLPETLSAGESAAEYFDLFFKMIDSEAALLFLTTRGCLTTLCRLVTQEVANVESHERSLSIDISQGFILHKLIELLSKFLEVPNIRVRFMKDELLHKLLESLLVIRGLVVQKTKLINDCNKLLKDLLDSLLLESSENKRQFIRACISGLQNHGKERKGRTSLFILEELCNMICPSKPELVYLLILNKAHTQEEFIRGSMTKNPYSSAEIGPLMRDVKNKICHQLDLLGLLEDDFGMELLVGGNIISLDLSITQVYEQVWKKHQHHSQSQITLSTTGAPSSGGLTSSRDCPPMTVTYRLQGLDGEATEPMIKELEEEREESQDPEVEFAIAGAVRDFGGLEIILSMIKDLRDNELKSNQEELGSVLNLLMYCCKIRENRRALLRLGALGLLLETARRAFSVDAMEPAEGILSIVESLTVEANESDLGISQSVCTISNEESGAGEQAKKMVLMFLERLCHPLGLKKSKQQRNNEMVARILPYLTYGEPAAMETLVQHFDPYLHAWDEFDRLQTRLCENPKDESLAQQAAKQRSSVENFVRVSESLKTSSSGERLKDIILEKGITDAAVRHLRECFAVAGQTGFKSTTEWASGLKLPSIPLILPMLRGLSKGHLATQRCIDEGGLLPMLHALEGVSGENDIGARAENLLDTLADKGSNGDDGFLEEKINKLRHATRNEMRRLALRKREELLQGLGMRQEFASDGGERIVVAQPVIEGLDDVEEEQDGLSCMVCREGYSLRPNDMLGVYTYSKRVNLGATASGGSRGDCVYTTVSHFNIIHFQCHQEAKRADAALKNPKKEWEGATLRNNETLCNCIFPLKGPSVPHTQYVRCVDQYWDNLNALGRADGSRLRLLTYDIVLMLARFATGASFSTDCKGGGRESNSRFLPFMLQMASHLLDHGSSSQQPRTSVAKSVEAYLSSADPPSRPPPRSLSPARLPAVGSSDEAVQFMMVNSLLSESYEDWTRHRPGFLQRGIHHAYMQHKHATTAVGLDEGSPSTDLDDSGKLFAIVHPMLVYVGLIEQLQRFFKLGKAEVTALDSGEGGRWETVMKERLMNVKEMVGFSKEMLSWLEEMTSASDLLEAFDVMGALGDALSGGSSRCEDFVLAAIQAGKS